MSYDGRLTGEAATRHAGKLISEWQFDPVRFVEEAVLTPASQEGHFYQMTGQQREALRALGAFVKAKWNLFFKQPMSDEELKLAKKVGISIMSGNGTGKDALASWIKIWFLCTWSHSLVPCTAPSAHQLKDVLWKETNKWLRQSIAKDWLTWQTDKIFWREAGGREWFAVGRTANPKSTVDEQTETLAGFHDDHMMILVDEASGIPEPVFAPLEGTLTGKVNFIVVIFNPTRSTGYAIDSQFKNRDQFICFRWNAEESEIVTPESIQQKLRKGGGSKESSYYRIRVLGLPPIQSNDTLIPWDWVDIAKDNLDIVALDTDQEVFSVDVGAGGDPSVILRRKGNVVLEILTNDTADSEVLTGWIMGKIFKHEPRIVFIDSIGWGWGIAGNLRSRTQVEIVDVNVAESATEDGRYHRLRDELWGRLRERFEHHDISIPEDDELMAQLTTIKYEEPNGKLKVESKRDLKRRGLDSPNKADALMMSEYYHSTTLRKMGQGKRNFRREAVSGSWKTI